MNNALGFGLLGVATAGTIVSVCSSALSVSGVGAAIAIAAGLVLFKLENPTEVTA